ncbi:unnamed protein product [Nesidiocoris tenuis]|uniref:Uncharacterized protein n=1 Tax=Nesidiocoris tenuis TaxID=355587 RepID=A0A6H5FZC7_9HEMI|nr:unnamed protein product [Nesidiocoris tenuis]
MISKTVKFCFRDAVSDYLSPDDRMEALKNITDLLSRTFSSQFVFPVLGHADPQEPEKLGQLWRQWLPTDALQTFNTADSENLDPNNQGGYYMIEQKSRRLKVIALNSNLWMEKYEDEIDPGGQWAWLDKHLDTAKRNGETVRGIGIWKYRVLSTHRWIVNDRIRTHRHSWLESDFE